MGLTLVACGEHYVFDVFLGWVYAGAILAGWSAWERRAGQGARIFPAIPTSPVDAGAPRASEGS